MAFIEPQKNIPLEELRVKIEQPVYQGLQKYAEFTNGTTSYVIQEVLRKVMSSDKDFQAFLNPDAHAKGGRKASAANQKLAGA